MSEAKEAPQPQSDAPPAAPAKASKLVPVVIGLNSLLLLAVIGFMFLQMKKQSHAAEAPAASKGDHEEAEAEDAKGEEHKEEKEPKKEEKEAKAEEKKEDKKGEGHEAKSDGEKAGSRLGPLVKISDFVIHLRNPEMDRYARFSFDVEVIGDADKEYLSAYMPRVRDAFITYLSDRTLEELQGAEGLGRTKDALQARLRDLVPEARVRNLYISDFVVQ